MCGCLKVGLLRCSLQAIFLYSSIVVMGVGSLARLHEREPWIHRWQASFLVGVDGHPQGGGTTPREGCWEGRVTEVGEAWRTDSAARLCLSSPPTAAWDNQVFFPQEYVAPGWVPQSDGGPGELVRERGECSSPPARCLPPFPAGHFGPFALRTPSSGSSQTHTLHLA